jgi:hypothetical protein
MSKNCAPCHLPNLDIWQNPRLAHGDVDHSCQVCHQSTGGSTDCDDGWHRACLDPSLLATPIGDWFCPTASVVRVFGTWPRLHSSLPSGTPYRRIEPNLLASACQTVCILVGVLILPEGSYPFAMSRMTSPARGENHVINLFVSSGTSVA